MPRYECMVQMRASDGRISDPAILCQQIICPFKSSRSSPNQPPLHQLTELVMLTIFPEIYDSGTHISWMFLASRLSSRMSSPFLSCLSEGIFTKGPLWISQICLSQMYLILQLCNLVNYYITDEICMWKEFISTKPN